MLSWQDLDLNQPINWNHSLNRGRQAWWLTVPLRYGAPTWWDLVKGRAGSLTGFPSGYGWNTASNPGGAGSLSCNGTAGYVHASLPDSGGAYTVAAWVRATTTTGTRNVLNWGSGTGGYSVQLRQDSGTWNLYQSYNNTDFNASYSGGVSLNNWQRVVATWDGQDIRIYVNGVSRANTVLTGRSRYGSDFYIGDDGNEPSSPTQFWQGNLNDVTVANRAWSAQDVFADYLLSRQRYPDVLNYHFNDVLPIFNHPIVTGSVVMRRTLSGLGARVGSRQKDSHRIVVT